MKLKLITAATVALLAGPALAEAPTASLNRSWTEYAGSQSVGNNKVNDNNSAYWIDEGTGTWDGKAVKSWFLIWDPRSSSRLEGTVSFAQDILFLHDTKAELQATAAFGKTGIVYDYSSNSVGLESSDKASWAGQTLSLKWTASSGDHVRVMTAVPEPESYAMFGAGLLALAFMARRRRA